MDEEENVNVHMNSRYNVLARHRGTGDLSSFFSNPHQSKPHPTEEDYRNGFVDRFLVRKSTSPNFPIYEVTNEQFQILRKNPFYISVSLGWKLTGSNETKDGGPAGGKILGVSDFNNLSISRADTFISGIRNFLTNPLEFYREV
jgi:hypothetical protein